MIRVVDVSEHQGPINMDVMRSRGVQGLILRISHGFHVDVRAAEHYRRAIDAGFERADIGWYSFINPKRGTGADTAEFAIEQAGRIVDGDPTFYMADIEDFYKEPPQPLSCAGWVGERFREWLWDHIWAARDYLERDRVIGYTNRAYWNGDSNHPDHNGTNHVDDPVLARELDWMVARYPVYSLAGYSRLPLPPTAAGWEAWVAARRNPDGTQLQPYPPIGADGWEGWQFSAGYNRQGRLYGCVSDDLDLNLVRPEAWRRWTGRTVSVPVDDQPRPDPHPQPVPDRPRPAPQEDDDMPAALIQVAGDPAVFVTDGLTCHSAVSGPTVERFQNGNVWRRDIVTVERADLRALRYEGPLPDYSTLDPSVAAAMPGRTRREDFGSFED